MLVIFQGGRLLAILFGSSDDIFRIDLQTLIPFDIPEQARLTTLLLLSLSASAVYCASLALGRKPVLSHANWGHLAPYALAVCLLFYPLHFYKTANYLQYVLQNGYAALYFDDGQHLKDVGFLARSGSQICQAAFAFYFCWETSLPRLRRWTIPMFVTVVGELLTGLRGHSLLLIFSFLFLYKVKSNGRFSLRLLAPLATVMLFVSLFVASFREDVESDDRINPAVLFLNSQGVSLQVTEVAVAERSQFERYRWNYLLYPILGEFVHQSDFSNGQRFSNDLSVALNARSFSMGFATGSAYLAEAYLVGGFAGVFLASVAIGWFLSRLNQWLADGRAPLAVMLLASVLFIPRSELMSPLSASIKECGSLLIAFTLISTLRLCIFLWNRPRPLAVASC